MTIKKININEACQSKIKSLVEDGIGGTSGAMGPIAQFGGGDIVNRSTYAKPTLHGQNCTIQDIGAERKACVK